MAVKITSAYANKMLRSLEAKAFCKQGSIIQYLRRCCHEEPVIPEYNYTDIGAYN